jgi:hypothetical protein
VRRCEKKAIKSLNMKKPCDEASPIIQQSLVFGTRVQPAHEVSGTHHRHVPMADNKLISKSILEPGFPLRPRWASVHLFISAWRDLPTPCRPQDLSKLKEAAQQLLGFLLRIRHQQARYLLISGKDYAATKHKASQAHSASMPETTDTGVDENAAGGLDRASTPGTLRSALDCVEWLAHVDGDGAGDGASSEGDGAVLRHIVRLCGLLEHVLGTHARRRCDALLEGR